MEVKPEILRGQTWALVPARMGSKRLPRKNLRTLGDHPLQGRVKVLLRQVGLAQAHVDHSQAQRIGTGVGTDTDWRLENGVHHVRVDDQRYEMPDAWMFGD